MRRFAERHLDKALDLLIERAVSERAIGGFYDKIIRVMRDSDDAVIKRILSQMKEHREQEKEHEDWLESQVLSLGGSPKSESEQSALVALEQKGIREVIEGDYGLPHLFHALLQAELADNSGWALLLDLAVRADDDDARRNFRKRLHLEEEHLSLMVHVVERFARKEVLGEQALLSAMI